jgi:hypothetical protein
MLNTFKLFAFIILYLINPNVNGQLARPTPIAGANSLNNFVNNAFSLYDNTNAVKSKLDAVQQQVLNKSLSSIDVDKTNNELTYLNKTLDNLLTNVTRLISSASEIPNKAKAELGNKPLLITGALLHVSTSLKALRQSEQNIQQMVKTVIPNIKASIAGTKTPSSNTMAGSSNATPLQPLQGSTTTSIITVENVLYNDVQAIADLLKANTLVKSINKTFSNGSAVLTINHASTSEELLDVLLKTNYGKKTEVLELSTSRVKLKMKQ